MKSRLIGILTWVWVATGWAAGMNTPALVPVPEKISAGEGTFSVTAGTTIYVDSASRATGEYLATQLRKSTGYSFKVRTKNTDSPVKNAILLTTRQAKADSGTEGYELNVAADSVVIRAPAAAGLFYGVQTLLQLLPPEIYAPQVASGVNWTIPVVQIEDKPRFKWRGLMLDVSRHFYTKQEVERLLDLMAMEKINTFHWHLVDDPGWRIEIKKYPKLTEIGAWRDGIQFGLDPKLSTAYGPDGRYGGFYTQNDIREVVAYASKLHITIIPEIEMPGHSSAALLAYPQLRCPTGKEGVYCAGNDEAFAFLQDVLAEVFPLFPSKYVHIGGDEVSKNNWKGCPKCQERKAKEGLKNEEELQSYFIRRIEKYVNSQGHTLIGWSEILQGGLAQNAVVMDWIGGGKEAASQGHDVIMTPTDFCYFDYYQSTNHTTEPKAIGGFLPLEKVYAFDPIPAGLPVEMTGHILGGQGNVWTEYISLFSRVEYMTFPRLAALAEVTWSPKETHNWDDFKGRLQTHEQRLDQLKVNYRKPAGLFPDAPTGLKVDPSK